MKGKEQQWHRLQALQLQECHTECSEVRFLAGDRQLESVLSAETTAIISG